MACCSVLPKPPFMQVCTILSQNTTDVNSARAFAKLKETFPDWELVRTAENGELPPVHQRLFVLKTACKC